MLLLTFDKMSIPSNDFHGLYRASANEGVPYSEDYSEPLLVLSEWIDNSLGAGCASKIDVTIDITNPRKSILRVNDNGNGIKSETRLMTWSSKDIGSNETENLYGHGSKKALTKWCPDYLNAKWYVTWRKQDRRGFSSALNELHGPFLGLDTKRIENDVDETTCMPHGTCWNIEFDLAILGTRFDTPKKIMDALEEIIRSRYEPSQYQPYTINIKIIEGGQTLERNSSQWKSLKMSLEHEMFNGTVIKTYNDTHSLDKTTVKVEFYQIIADGRSFNIPGMPLFGKRNMNSQRVHIARGGRYIEAMPYSKFMGKEIHNSDNGLIGFISFTGEELPIPCTTKVKMQEEDPIFKKMTSLIKKHLNAPTALKKAKAPAAKVAAPASVKASAPAKAVPVAVPIPAKAVPVQVKLEAKEKAPAAKEKAPVAKAPVLSAPVLSAPVLSAPVLSAPVLSAAAPVKTAPVQAKANVAAPAKSTPIVAPIVAPTPIATPTLVEVEEQDQQIDPKHYNMLKDLHRIYGTEFIIDVLTEIDEL
jgi:hypothetical protein